MPSDVLRNYTAREISLAMAYYRNKKEDEDRTDKRRKWEAELAKRRIQRRRS